MKLSPFMLALAALAGCAPMPVYAPPPMDAPPAPGPWYGHDHGQRPHPYPPAPPRYTYVSPDPSDPCGARELAWLVGRDRSAVPAQRPNQAWRVYSTDMGVTADYSAARLNVLYDARTGRVLRVSCG